ncbi:L-2-amino-thiazoline-4-carboxylic acid hydrolase [Bradyrhizobium jicamae]|nr:L-2-amino-thiazoline-4-carboxylic acid hydrolase [Bradyrhizobium jicamae]
MSRTTAPRCIPICWRRTSSSWSSSSRPSSTRSSWSAIPRRFRDGPGVRLFWLRVSGHNRNPDRRADFDTAKGFGDDIELTRMRTIMQGASHCDFRYRRIKPAD